MLHARMRALSLVCMHQGIRAAEAGTDNMYGVVVWQGKDGYQRGPMRWGSAAAYVDDSEAESAAALVRPVSDALIVLRGTRIQNNPIAATPYLSAAPPRSGRPPSPPRHAPNPTRHTTGQTKRSLVENH